MPKDERAHLKSRLARLERELLEVRRELEHGSQDAAEAALREVLYLAPDLAEAHYRLGLLCARRGDKASARRSFLNALRASERRGPGDLSLAAAVGAQLADLDRS